VRKDLENVLKAIAIIEGVKREVDFYNPIYSTGIITPRENLEILRKLGFNVKTDVDFFKLVQAKGTKLVEEIVRRFKESGSSN